MRFLQFDGATIKKEYEVKIDVVISSIEACTDINRFFQNAVDYLDEEVYPEYNVKEDYLSASLKSGQYREIVQHWISTIVPKLHFDMDDICDIRRVKHNPPDPCCEEFVFSTTDEYIMFMVSITE